WQIFTHPPLCRPPPVRRPAPAPPNTLSRSPVPGGYVLVLGLTGDHVGAGPRLGVTRDGYHAIPGCEVHQPDPHRLPPRLLHLGGRGPDDTARRGDRVDLVLGIHHERPDKLAALVDDPGAARARRPASLGRVLVDGGPLGVTACGGDQDVRGFPYHVHAEQLVAVGEPHPDNTRRGPAHRPERLVGRVEPQGLRLLAHQQQVLVQRRQPRADHLVVLPAVHRADPPPPRHPQHLPPAPLHQP